MGISARSRPAAIVGVTIFMAINGLMVLLNPMEGPDGAPSPGTTAASTLFGTLLLVVAWRLFALARWAWGVTLAFYGLAAALAIVDILRVPEARAASAIELALAALVLLALTRPRVRDVFARRTPTI